MTDKELMQQALDALNLELPSGAYLELKNALRDRLAQPEQDFDAIAERQLASLKRATRKTTEDAVVRAVHKMADEPQPEQEPVRAWFTHDEFQAWVGKILKVKK